MKNPARRESERRTRTKRGFHCAILGHQVGWESGTGGEERGESGGGGPSASDRTRASASASGVSGGDVKGGGGDASWAKSFSRAAFCLAAHVFPCCTAAGACVKKRSQPAGHLNRFVVPTARGESEDGGVGVGEADEATSSSDAASARAAASAAAKALPASQ